jgi:hypothetical protein
MYGVCRKREHTKIRWYDPKERDFFQNLEVKGRTKLKVYISQDRNHLRVLDKTIMKLRFPQIAKKFLAN